MAVEEDLNASSSSRKDDKIQEDLFHYRLIADLSRFSRIFLSSISLVLLNVFINSSGAWFQMIVDGSYYEPHCISCCPE